jgi:Domain of unknown function (DUF222)
MDAWQRFETSRNRLPLIDHQLIADADASDLAGEYCFSNLRMLLTRTLQLSPAEAAARVRAAAAVGPRTSELGEAVDPVLPHLAAAQRIGQVVCRYHHTHFLQKGWTCRINADGCQSGYRHAGSTPNNDPNSTRESDACIPNGNSAGDDLRRLHE